MTDRKQEPNNQNDRQEHERYLVSEPNVQAPSSEIEEVEVQSLKEEGKEVSDFEDYLPFEVSRQILYRNDKAFDEKLQEMVSQES